MRPLTIKQKRFAEYYEGNGTEACRQAGYQGNDNVLAQQAKENLRKPHIVEIIQQRHLDADSGYIADREQRQEFWTAIMLSDEPLPIRLKASEILGRSCGDFIARVELSQALTFKEIVDSFDAGDEPLVKEDQAKILTNKES